MKPANSSSATSPRHPADRRRRLGDLTGLMAPDALPWFAGAVSFRVRRLEPMVAWVLAGFTVWQSIVLYPAGASVWWMALLAASLGGWSRMFPARHQVVMFARGMVLVLAAFLLHVAPDASGATGPYFLWSVMTTLFYALLLSVGWAAVLAASALLEFGLACWMAQPSPSWQLVLAYAGFLVVVAPLSMAFGRALRESDEQAESSLRDERTMLYNESGFFVHGAVLLAECRKAARPFTMVLLNGSDLRDIPELLGRKVANDLFAQAVQAIGSIPSEGIAARIDSVEFAVLLPGSTAERAAALVKQRLGDPPQLEIKINAKPIAIMLDVAIAQVKDQSQTIEELYDSLHKRWVARHASTKAPKGVPVMDADDERFGLSNLHSTTVPIQLPAYMRPPKK